MNSPKALRVARLGTLVVFRVGALSCRRCARHLLAHRWGVVALGVGLALSFTVVGLPHSNIGGLSGPRSGYVSSGGGSDSGLFGLVLIIPRSQDLFARAASHLFQLLV
jgi:hypothetical protein